MGGNRSCSRRSGIVLLGLDRRISRSCFRRSCVRGNSFVRGRLGSCYRGFFSRLCGNSRGSFTIFSALLVNGRECKKKRSEWWYPCC